MVTIQSQNFGVEIEMTGVSRGTAASVIANYFGVGGIHFAGGTYQTYEAKDSKGRVCEQRSQHHVDTEHHASQHKGLFHVAVLGAIFIFVVVGEQRVVVRISERAGQQQEAFVEARLDTGSSQAGVDVDECTVGVYQRGNDNDCQQTVNNHP